MLVDVAAVAAVVVVVAVVAVVVMVLAPLQETFYFINSFSAGAGAGRVCVEWVRWDGVREVRWDVIGTH